MQMGYPAEQIATAVIDMLAEKEFTAPVKEISEVRERSRGSKGRSPERSRSKRSHENGMVRLAIDAGRKNGIRPGDVIYVIASSAQIPGKAIGAINIGTNETFVDVPEQHVDAVLRANGGKVKGQQVSVSKA